MSVTLNIDNFPSLNIKEQTSLSADVAAAVTSLPLVNNDDIVANDAIIVGRRGSETGELRIVASVSGATIATVDALTLRHDAYEDVTALRGRQIKIYRASNVNGTAPADASFIAYGSPFDLDADQLSTTYIDANGDSTYWYKYTYFNPVTSIETDLGLTIAVRGGAIGQYATIDDIRGAADFSNNRNITDFYIDGFRRSAQDQINAALSGTYVIPFTTPVNGFISRITVQLAAGFLKLDQFGKNNEEGNAMIDWAEDQINKIRGGEYTLTDAAGSTLPKPGGGGGVPGGGMGFSGYPNNSEQDDGFHFFRTKRY